MSIKFSVMLLRFSTGNGVSLNWPGADMSSSDPETDPSFITGAALVNFLKLDSLSIFCIKGCEKSK